MPICLYCGKDIKTPKGDISDGCCSDSCWEAYYAPGPSQEAELEYSKMKELA